MSEDVHVDLVRRCAPRRRHSWVASDLRLPARAIRQHHGTDALDASTLMAQRARSLISRGASNSRA